MEDTSKVGRDQPIGGPRGQKVGGTGPPRSPWLLRHWLYNRLAKLVSTLSADKSGDMRTLSWIGHLRSFKVILAGGNPEWSVVVMCNKFRRYFWNLRRYGNGKTEGSHIRAFDWYQNHRPWMTLNDLERPKRNQGQKKCVFGAHCTNLNEDRPIHAATKM